MAPITDPDTLPKERQPIVISGPSGSGKSTMLKMLFEKYPGRFGFSVSHTTRAPRGAEQDGVDYFFTSVPQFEEMIREGGFIEHAKFGSNYYGTSFKAVESIEEKGQVCVLDIEMEGVKQVHNSHLKARYLFLQPPTFEILEQRLRGRATDKEEDIQKRLKQAKVELEYAQTPGAHDKIVVNDDKDRAFEEVERFCLGKE
ncbi:hypothetical protein EG328_007025 [Venturia inaequalis]|uniref:Guanylate kinase n=1 Tax=Venturia inaequalis TaxID=5025 RepID=A0A8H3UGQ9_VENIN|nr:hypothetical protein EG328_007025 [Venturia inaequalis]RDI85430.1 hypothetical protein Vi05172_g4819 [Venturia inaequalis]